ncbi:MAG: 4,5-DOPA dioxygenase extradiol [Chlorobiaceae bacterium]|nr:4,5-DOPA dioxygenase extradiol [Chlorobiaceae bacterium]
MGEVMPAVFFGHGNPMNAIESNTYTESWQKFGQSIPRPKAILAISAHWYVPDMAVSGNTSPDTIHDFYGFPRELFEYTWPAPGSPELGLHVQKLLQPLDVRFDEQRGLDHGVWAVLCHVFPDADIPVVQLSIDERKPPEFHYETGKLLQPLRDEGVLIVGSGNIVHNLHAYVWENEKIPPFDWALRFESATRSLILEEKDRELIDYRAMGEDARLSVPSPDHFLPLLFVLGLRRKHEQISFPVEGIEGGALSMLSVRIG